jgi:hypothetical protein
LRKVCSVTGWRRDVAEVELAPLGGEQRAVVGVDPSARKVPAREPAPLLRDIGDGHDLDVVDVSRAARALEIPGGVAALHDESVPDQGAAQPRRGRRRA